MRVLLLHAERFSYIPTKKAVSQAEELAKEYETNNALVVFTTVEEGDNEAVIQKASKDITEQVDRLKASTIVIYPYAHLSSNLAPLGEARQVLEKLAKDIEKQGFSVHKAPFGWYKSFEIKVHGHPLAELSRSYTPTERIPPLMETTRDFSSKFYEDYLTRFGFRLEEKRAVTKTEWLLAINDLREDLKECAKPLETVFTKQLETETFDNCTEFEFEALAQPIRSFFLEKSIITSLDKIKNILGESRLTIEDKYVYLEGNQFKFLIAIKINSNNAFAMLNTILAGLIAINVEKTQTNQYTPMLPIKYSIVQAYVAINKPVSHEFIERVKSKLEKKIKRLIIDESDQKLAEKLRRAGMLWTPYVVIIGKREEESNAVSIRFRLDGTTRLIPIDELEKYL